MSNEFHMKYDNYLNSDKPQEVVITINFIDSRIIVKLQELDGNCYVSSKLFDIYMRSADELYEHFHNTTPTKDENDNILFGNVKLSKRKIEIVYKIDKTTMELALYASSLDFCEDMINKYGEDIKEKIKNGWNFTGWVRKVNQKTGEGFRDITVSLAHLTHRFVVYSPGEYVQPHYHNMYERFNIRFGGCHFWLSSDGIIWTYSYCDKELDIPPFYYHCLVASINGLIMDIKNDISRTIDWYTKDSKLSNDFNSIKEGDWEVTVQKLIEIM